MPWRPSLKRGARVVEVLGQPAIIPLTVTEASTARMLALAEEDPVMCVWWASEIECVSALARLEREGALTDSGVTVALERLDLLAEGWNEVQPVVAVRSPLVASFGSTPCGRLTRISWPPRSSLPRPSRRRLRSSPSMSA